MSFDTTAIQGLIPLEKSVAPRLPLVSFGGRKGKAMTSKKTLRKQIQGLWADMRSDGDMLVDNQASKIGMPYAVPYEGVCFPVEEDGDFIIVRIPVDQVERFALALASAIPASRHLDAECDAEIAAHGVINKLRGGGQ